MVTYGFGRIASQPASLPVGLGPPLVPLRQPTKAHISVGLHYCQPAYWHSPPLLCAMSKSGNATCYSHWCGMSVRAKDSRTWNDERCVADDDLIKVEHLRTHIAYRSHIDCSGEQQCYLHCCSICIYVLMYICINICMYCAWMCVEAVNIVLCMVGRRLLKSRAVWPATGRRHSWLADLTYFRFVRVFLLLLTSCSSAAGYSFGVGFAKHWIIYRTDFAEIILLKCAFSQEFGSYTCQLEVWICYISYMALIMRRRRHFETY